MDDDEHPEFGDWFDPEEDHDGDDRRPSPKVLGLIAVTGLIIVVIAVAAGISAITDKSTDDDPVAGVRVGASTAITVPTTTSSTTTPTPTSAAPEPGTFEAEFASESETVPRLGDLSVLEARGHARTMCLRMDSHVSEADILGEAEKDNGLNPDVAKTLLDLAKETVCPEQDDTPDEETGP